MSIPPIQALSPEINIYGYIIILKKRHCSEASWSGPSNHMPRTSWICFVKYCHLF